MRRPLALILVAALIASCVPAEAGMMARALPAAGAARVMTAPSYRVPASMMSLSPSALRMAAPSLSLSPAGNDNVQRPLALLPPSAVPAAAASDAVPVAPSAATPPKSAAVAPAPSRRAATADAPHAEGAAPRRAAFDVLTAVAAPDAEPSLSAWTFDGSRLRAAADAPRASPASDTPRGPKLEKPTPKRPFFGNGPSFYGKFQDGIGYTAVGGALLAAAWGVIPWGHIPLLAIFSGTVAVGVVITMDLARNAWRLGRRLAGKPVAPPVSVSAPKKRLALLSGMILGAGIFGATLTYEAPLLERYHAVMESRTEAPYFARVRAVKGDAFTEETVRILSENPVGRRVLDQLRDRGGVLRLPAIFVADNPGNIMASHAPLTNGVYIDESQITALGFTMEQFVNDPDVQRQVAARVHTTMLHELTHALQDRRSPLDREYYQQSMQREYEAYVNELFYIHERLKADPSTELSDDDETSYLESLSSLDSYLRGIDIRDAYRDNVHIDNARWRAWSADLAARWPAHRAEAYHLLALREHANGMRYSAATYQNRAVEAAQAAGLPAPPPLPNR